MSKLSPWIPDPDYPDCFMRILESSDQTKLENRVAFIEKTPRIRVAPFTDVNTDYKNWKQGRKGCGDKMGSYQPSRDWCDEQLINLGYLL
jgi:hypothetical protein